MDPELTAADGSRLKLHAWAAPTAQARGAVLIVHGLGEHGLRYAHVGADLNARGWNVAAYDQRGHGASGGARGRIAHADDLLRDLALVIDHVRSRWPGRLVVLGHSLGGLVAARFAAEALAREPAEWSRALDALALSSPALDPGLTPVQKLLLAILAPLAPSLGVSNGVTPQFVSRDREVVRAYVEDPLVHDRIAGRLARFVVDAAAIVLDRARDWRVPTLLMFAGRDRLVSPRGSRVFAERAPRAVLRVREFPELYHEILNEPERAEVLAELAAWLASLQP
jgi:alpha-beta hydrolase superfamily lysophospholipase